MNYLYESIQPTRLYIKQCPHCGLKYFGKTTLEDVKTYRGSGTKWNNHLDCHSVEPIHLWNSDWYHDTSISRFALRFSRMNSIVSSKQWANLKEENGLDGGWDHYNGSSRHILSSSVGGTKGGNILAENFKKGIITSSQLWFTPKGLKVRSKMGNAARKEKYPNGISFKQSKQAIDNQKKSFMENKHQQGSKNSQFGTMWITDGNNNKKIRKDSSIPLGWEKGRCVKKQ